MNTALVILLVVAMIFVVVSLVRGIVAFLQSHRADIDAGGERQKDMQLLQNRMMMNRIKFQALAIVIVAILLMMNH
ncbi:MAG TPA: twin transmembrane helix small protein [Croceibacterium sp.]|nr:twin transmembrane helix small protein [Croceibacterium sp.]